jgi:hypothetical protein
VHPLQGRRDVRALHRRLHTSWTHQEEVDQAVADIQAANLNTSIEGDIQDFLGVNIERNDDGPITFTQPHLTDKVLEATRLQDGKEKNTSRLRHKDERECYITPAPAPSKRGPLGPSIIICAPNSPEWYILDRRQFVIHTLDRRQFEIHI